MLRKSVFALAVLLSSLATQVYALGLGTVTVESYLNQPLRVRIEILDLGGTRLQDITVQMASVDDFTRFNIDRIGFLSNVRFRVEETAGGNYVILTTNQVVREPYLSFILETRWPNGRLLSEHTILMDLPVFNDQPANADSAQVRRPISPVLQPPSNNTVDQPFVDSTPAAPVTPSSSVAPILEPEIIAPEPEPAAAVEPESAAIEPEEQPAPTSEPAAPARESMPESAAAEPEEEPAVVEEVAATEPAADDVMEEEQVTPQAAAEPAPIDVAAAPEPEETAEPTTITTSASDTLTSIAEQVRPDSSVSLQQTMMALQELNPDAFIGGNINRLRSGQVLRVPSREEIESIDAADAVAEVSRQNQAFADVQPLAAPSTATPAQDQPSGQLSVVSADDAIDATGGGGELDDEENAALDRRIAELENQLALRQEEADRARIEREELDSRLADLEQQIAAAEELIRLQDLQLAQLQESIAQAAAEAEADAAAQAAIAAAQAELEQQPQGGGLVSDIMRILTGNTMMMIFGVVLVVLLLVVLLLRRNKASAAREEDELDELAEQEFDASTDTAPAAITQAGAADSDADDGSDFDQELDDILAATGSGDADEDEAPEESEGDELEGNPVAQADILIAHEQYAQAADLLREAIVGGDDESALRMKLLDVLALDGNREAFEAEARIIADEQSPRLDRDVNQLREKYGFDAPAGAAQEDDLETFALDDGDTEDTVEASPVVEAVTEEDAEEDDAETSFLDDLGIDLDSFDADSDDDDLEFSDEMDEKDSGASAVAGTAATEEKKADADLDIDGDDMDLTFDLGDGDEEASDADARTDDSDEIDLSADMDLAMDDEPAPEKEAETDAQESTSEELDLDAVLDLDDEGETAELASGSSKDAAELEIESFEFDAGDLGGESAEEEAQDAAKDEEDLEIETFSFDAEDTKPETPKEPEPEVEIDAENLMDFDFDDDDKAELSTQDDTSADDKTGDDIESFEFDIDESSSTTVIEPAETVEKTEQAEAAAETTVDDFDFDLDELETAEPGPAAQDSGADDDVIDLDSAFEGLEDKDANLDDDVEIDFDAIDDEPASSAAADDDDDLDFLADDDDDDGIEIESVGDVEEVDLLSDDDETATKLELAYAYQKMGDAEGAREILQEVIAEGTDEQVKEARELMATLDSAEG